MLYRFRLFIVGLLLTLIIQTLPVSAQEQELDGSFVADDGTFEIAYPAGWTVDNSDPAFVAISGFMGGYQISISAFSTQIVIPYAAGEMTAYDVAVNLAAEPLIEDDAQPLLIGAEETARDAAVASVEVEQLAGVAFIIAMRNGDYGMVIAVSSRNGLEANSDLILSIVESYNTPLQSIDGALLTHYADSWQAAIDELQELAIIGEGGSLVFEEDEAFFTGQGFVFTPMGRRSPHPNIVMAGEIHFTSASAEYEDCSLLARVVNPSGGTVNTYLQVGFDNSRDVFYYDSLGTEESTVYQLLPMELDLTVPHHLLMVVSEEFLTVYVDGQRIFDNVQINAERAGTYGIALLGQHRDSRCEGRNIWVYEFPIADTVECVVRSANTINKRSGPGTNFVGNGILTPQETPQAIAQTIGADGFIWWQLDDETWVRDDIVSVEGDCENVPQAE
jgi:hypothetical protein